MSSSVFLARCDRENFDRTVGSTVDLNEFADRPDALADAEAVRLWGVSDDAGAERYVENLAAGDLVLFYRDGEFVGTGRVGTVVADADRWASEELWTGLAAEHVYTVEDFTPLSVPKPAVNRMFGYADGYNPQEFMRVADDRVESDPDVIERAMEKYDEKHE